MIRAGGANPWFDTETLGALAASAVLIGTGYTIWEQIPVNLHLAASILSLACYLFGFAMMAVAANRRVGKPVLVLAALLFAFLAYAACVLTFGAKYYGTDSLLFNAYSADMLMHGIDPYTQSMQPAFHVMSVPDSLVTPTVDGNAVYKLSYPALSVLIYLPALLLHVDNLLWVSVAAHAALIVALWWLAPAPLKTLLPLLVFVDASYAQYTVGAVTDVLWVVPAVFAAAYWRTDLARSAVLIGIACAMKQTPWLLVPFALIDWTRAAIRQRALSVVAVPCALLVTAFLVPNAPFIAWHPQAWLSGVLEPLNGSLIMFGSGLVQLQTANVVSFDPHLLSWLSIAALGVALIVYVLRPAPMVVLPYVAPAVAYFLAPRSLQNYFMYWPIMLGARLTRPLDLPEALPSASLALRGVAGAGLAAVAAVIVVLFGVNTANANARDPQIAIVNTNVDQNAGLLRAVTVRGFVRSGPSRYVRFAMYQEGTGTDFAFLGSGVVKLGSAPRSIVLPLTKSLSARVSPNNALQIVAVDAFSGEQFFSPAWRFDIAGAFLRNGSLKEWSAPPHPMPVGWDYSLPDVLAGYVERAGPRALRLRVSAPRDAEWRVVAVSQGVAGGPGVLRFRLKPDRNYVGDAYPRAIFGIEVVDALQNHEYYTIDSRLSAERTFRRDRFVVHVLPGRLDDWNTVLVRLPAVGPLDRAAAGLSPTVRINVIAAITRTTSGASGGDFGGVSVGSGHT